MSPAADPSSAPPGSPAPGSPGPAPAAPPGAPAGGAQGAAPERFDDLLQRLRAVVEKLESGNLSLEDGLRFFEEGMALCRRGAEILDGAEKRVEQLLAAPGGGTRAAPFDAGSSSERNE
jgi:exodeoxyribonuclease VII small subunit